jgi:indolepyruvate ferredoxin oxidoreductase beta subunit
MNQIADAGDGPIHCILIAALGGEGGGVLADWLVQCALRSGLPVQATSVPGVAQRTGATSYYIELLRAPLPPGAAAPVFALSPVPGRVDVVVASELLEAARMVERGFVTPDRTALIASTHRVYTTIEKMHMADGRHDPERIVSTAQSRARRTALIDMERLSIEAGTVISAVMFGALSGAGVLPWPRERCESVISASGRGAKASLAGFALAYAAVASPVEAPVARPRGAAEVLDDAALPDALRAEWKRRIAGWPAALTSIAAHGALRCRDYQGGAYATRYLDRVETLQAASSPGSMEALCEAARHLALWMCFEDVIRVADLKSRRDRVARVRREVQAESGELVRVTEYFKPGIEEIAAVLPAAIGARLLAVSARRGWDHSFVGLHIRSTSLWGHLMLRVLAWLRPLRPFSLRFRQEHAAMHAWLAAMEEALPASSAMALALAGMPQVIKGYGDTQRRGRENYARLWAEHVAPALPDGERLGSSAAASALRDAIRATLADPEGKLNTASRTRGESRPVFWARSAPPAEPRSASQ